MASKYSRKGTPQAQMALREHLREFRNRVIKAAIATVLAAVAGFFFYYPVMRAITAPIAAPITSTTAKPRIGPEPK